MDFLARREHSFFELSQKLIKKFPDTAPEQLTAIIKTLQDENLQSDDRFAESYVRYRRSRGFGFLHIKVRRAVCATVAKAKANSRVASSAFLQASSCNK